jgi:hypothetical protein
MPFSAAVRKNSLLNESVIVGQASKNVTAGTTVLILNQQSRWNFA